jgi:hypothetical protein
MARTAIVYMRLDQLRARIGKTPGPIPSHQVPYVVATLDGVVSGLDDTVNSKPVGNARRGIGQLRSSGFIGMKRLDSFVQEHFISSHCLPHSNSLSRFFNLDLAL